MIQLELQDNEIILAWLPLVRLFLSSVFLIFVLSISSLPLPFLLRSRVSFANPKLVGFANTPFLSFAHTFFNHYISSCHLFYKSNFVIQ